MIKLKPIALAAMGCGLLTACSAPPVQRPLALQPVVRGDMPGNQAASWNRLARFHHERGQLALALGAYAQSLALDANQLDARNAVAVIEAQRGDLELARKALAALVKDYPGEAQPHTNLGYVQFLMGDHAGAAETLRRAMALGAGPKAFQNLQLAEAAMGKVPAADAPQLAAAPSAPAPATDAAPSVVAPSVVAPSVVAPSVVAPSVVAPAVVAAPEAAKPNMALLAETEAAPAAGSPARREPQPLAIMPSPVTGELANQLQLIKVAGNVYELKARVAPEPAAAPAIPAAPIIAAVEPQPAQPAVATGDKVGLARLEVSNGNGVTGMARRFRSVLGQVGIPVDRLTNAKPYRQVVTVIQYRPGFEKQAASLQKALQGKVQLSSQQLAASDMRLVLGKDARVSLSAATEAAAMSMVAMQQKD
ncbi:LytR cell envelope-related transcriptional attenuator [Duganella sp. CF458]|uniref:LytR C-terminal domain-containing protein n=1 Tax=Duganella sp. CF458 TaxID=1884368 RepID=UPI0008DEE584|nr:LytR C-terminal domain-containing protein [Duganella sp. CF458]SFF92586.1 LytR cell envelope-related transcriptional attenuator [Duganella sp. CF458]